MTKRLVKKESVLEDIISRERAAGAVILQNQWYDLPIGLPTPDLEAEGENVRRVYMVLDLNRSTDQHEDLAKGIIALRMVEDRIKRGPERRCVETELHCINARFQKPWQEIVMSEEFKQYLNIERYV